ncbi:ABC transporter permease [Gracilimonas sp. BCB1]|uniref:ABC transporter permease n=1 Tax=Gracilimonas sp. BCB1 TaxID=3152362 RepID=UPI0032D91484
MLKNYFKIALRNLFKDRLYSVVNILGLAVGLACVLLIAVYVMHELSYDKFHTNYDKLYRVTESVQADGSTDTYATTYPAIAHVLGNEFPSIDKITHIYPSSGLITGPGNTSYQEDGIVFADSTFFEMFSFNFVKGNPATALDQPLAMVITESSAAKFFGDTNPVGQSLRLKDSRNTFDFEITGVTENPPSNSHIQYDYLISYESLKHLRPWEYSSKYHPPMYTYVQLSNPEAVPVLVSQFPAFEEKYYGDDYAESASFGLQPISEIHLYSNLQNELSANFDITYIYIFIGVGVFILIIACINFMNLATARSAKRGMEVGMRKTMGAQRGQLIGQFLGEAIIMTFLGFGLALIFVEAIFPFFNDLTGYQLSLSYLGSREIILAISGVVIGIGVLAGSYPAFYLSSFKPIQTLKGERIAEKSSITSFRKGLVAFQFCISTALIFATVIITQQLDYIQNKKLGFEKEQVLIMPIRETANQFNVSTLKGEIERIPGVQSASAASGLPGIKSGIHGFMVTPGDNPADSTVMQTLTVDHDYVQTLGLNLIHGRNFSKDFSTDEDQAFIINETAAKRLGWTADPLDKELTLSFYVTSLVQKTGKVIGVVEDFQYNSLHNSIDPVVIHVFKQTFYHDYLSVKLASDNVMDITASIEEEWNLFNPDRPFEYFFLDATFDSMYRSEEKLSGIFKTFAFIAILIACLGLLGLASYSIQQRVKEIGIRKVLGARVSDIVMLLGKDFTLLIIIAQVLALPPVYIFMNRWLTNFTDQTPVSPSIFILCGIAVLIVSWFTIGVQSIKAALKNPVKSLRSE